jgi:hypothetical protein
MRPRLLETIVLSRDLPEHGLLRGDVGTVVDVYEPDAVEVEFVTGAGATQALLTLNDRDVRSLAPDELMSVRKLKRSA